MDIGPDFSKIETIQYVVLGLVLIIGFDTSMLIWCYKNKKIPNWNLLLPWTYFDPTFLKEFFIKGPGIKLVIIWMLIALGCAYLTPFFYK